MSKKNKVAHEDTTGWPEIRAKLQEDLWRLVWQARVHVPSTNRSWWSSFHGCVQTMEELGLGGKEPSTLPTPVDARGVPL